MSNYGEWYFVDQDAEAIAQILNELDVAVTFGPKYSRFTKEQARDILKAARVYVETLTLETE
jgi:hypothetical protein